MLPDPNLLRINQLVGGNLTKFFHQPVVLCEVDKINPYADDGIYQYGPEKFAWWKKGRNYIPIKAFTWLDGEVKEMYLGDLITNQYEGKRYWIVKYLG